MPLIKAKKDFVAVLQKALGGIVISEKEISYPPNPVMGDLSFPTFSFSKKLGRSPNEVALRAMEKFVQHGFILKLEARGPYINAFLDRKKFAKAILDKIKKEKIKYTFGKRIPKSKSIILEFVSPNTNKPLHLGHLRNAFLGSTLANIMASAGDKVVRSILYNDRGINIMKSMLAYMKFGNGETPKSAHEKGDHFVGRYYVKFGDLLKIHPELEAEAQEALLRWEKGDRELISLWKKMNSWAEGGFEETLKRIGVSFDAVYHESTLYEKGKKIVFDALKKGIFTRDEKGNIIAPLEKFNLPNKVMLRSDGTAVYATTDLALARERWRKYKFRQMIYVVGMEQDLHFKQLFKIFELLGEPYSRACEHLSYNWVYLPEGRMKSREGRVVDADALLDELWSLALGEVKSRYETLSEVEAENRAEVIAQAALKYYILEIDPKSDIHFNPGASLAFSGRTGPYIQYSYARISSLLKKAKGLKAKAVIPDHISETEHRLLVLLGKYEEIISDTLAVLNPSELSKYLFELAKAFSDFYETEPVLKGSKKMLGFRLVLSKSVASIIASGSSLLGIKMLREM